MTDHDFWVVHSPYPDNTWRGIEKCITSEEGVPKLFLSEDQASYFASKHYMFTPVRIALITPRVRGDLNQL